MEYKIGQIFEMDGIWYQFVRDNSNGCNSCVFHTMGCKCVHPQEGVRCGSWERRDETDGHFVRLLPLEDEYEQGGDKWQQYKCIEKPNTEDERVYIADTDSEVGLIVSIRLTSSNDMKSEMEEKKITFPKEDNALTRTVYAYVNGKISDKELIRSIKEVSDEYPYNKNNLKPFSLELAKQGKPVCTQDGRKARVICFDKKGAYPIVALVNDYNEEEYIKNYDEFGKKFIGGETSDDLMMLPQEGWVNVSKFSIYASKEEALSHKTYDIIDTIKVSWEE